MKELITVTSQFPIILHKLSSISYKVLLKRPATNELFWSVLEICQHRYIKTLRSTHFQQVAVINDL